MPPNRETVNVNADPDVTSIQITINLGKNSAANASPGGVYIRHAFTEPGENPVKKIRFSFVPDNATQNSSSHTFDANQAEPTKWLELLGDPQNFDLDAGVLVFRVSEEGGIIAWLPANTQEDPIVLPVIPTTETEPGGVSLGDFLDCVATNGGDAAAAINCLGQL